MNPSIASGLGNSRGQLFIAFNLFNLNVNDFDMKKREATVDQANIFAVKCFSIDYHISHTQVRIANK